MYEARRHIVRTEPFVVIEGRVQKQMNTINLLAERIWVLNEASATFQAPGASGSSTVRERNGAAAAHDFH